MNISSNLTYSHTPVFEKINGAFRLYSHNNADRYAKDTVLEAGDPQMLCSANGIERLDVSRLSS